MGFGSHRATRSGGGSTTVKWELCGPGSEDEGCTEVKIDIPWYYSPDEPEVGYTGGLVLDGVPTFASPVTFMGKKYRAGQDFPKALRKYVLEFAIDPLPSRLASKFKGRDGWENFLDHQLDITTR